MATHTTNYNLEKPEASDQFGDFRQSYNDNMDIIDANLGGGGGGGHTIIDPNGSNMAQRAGLQFTGSCSVTDDSVNDKTVVNISGGGGSVNYSTSEQVIGTWIDGKPLYKKTWDFSGSPVMLSYADWVNSGISAGENIKAIMSAELKYGAVILASVEVGVNVDGYPVGFQKLDNLNTRGVSYCTLIYTKTTD